MIGQKGIVLSLGDIVRYKSNSMIHPDAIYEGEVIGVYKYYYEVLGCPVRSTMKTDNEWLYGEPKPYRFCIPKYIDTRQDQIVSVNSFTYGDWFKEKPA